jgi:dipeptidase D
MVEEIIHAGVECGLFSDGIPDLDVVSFGPELRDIHTPRETMDLASVERTWRFILSVLEKLSEA